MIFFALVYSCPGLIFLPRLSQGLVITIGIATPKISEPPQWLAVVPLVN